MRLCYNSNMQRGRNTGGYTIVEVMIFLAISAFMFVVAAFFIQGKQSTAQFRQAMNSINTEVEQDINNVADNSYTPITTAQCSPFGLSAVSITNVLSGSSNAQGADTGCIDLGKVVQFGVGGASKQFDTYTVVGCQYSPCTNQFTDNTLPNNIQQAAPTVADPGTNNTCSIDRASSTMQVNLTTCALLQWGVYATAMYDYSAATPTNPPEKTNSIGFFGSFAPISQGLLPSGSQNIQVVDPAFYTPSGIDISKGSATNVPEGNSTHTGMVDIVKNYLTSASLNYIANPYFVVCFSDGRGHVGALTIGSGNNSGSSGQRLNTSIQIATSAITPVSAYSGYTCPAN